MSATSLGDASRPATTDQRFGLRAIGFGVGLGRLDLSRLSAGVPLEGDPPITPPFCQAGSACLGEREERRAARPQCGRTPAIRGRSGEVSSSGRR